MKNRTSQWVYSNQLAKFLLLLFFSFSSSHLLAQHEPDVDSLGFYKKLDVRSRKSVVGRWLFESIVVMKKPPKVDKKKKKSKILNPFKKLAGKVIRSVEIRVLDPFGVSVNDTARLATNRLERYGNNIHITSRQFLIRNLLLFKANDSLDVLALSETERILRQAPYLSDARVYVYPLKNRHLKQNDSVDVVVWVQDQWTLLPESGFDPTYPNLLLRDKNFVGMGIDFRQEAGYRFAGSDLYLEGRFGLFNYRKTFISGYFNYLISSDKKQYGIDLDRPFFSPLTRWAAGLKINRTLTGFTPYLDSSRIPPSYAIHYNLLDAWVGHSWQLQKGKSIEERSTSIIAGARTSALRFTQRPGIEIDSFFQNASERLNLVSVGLARREFYKEKYLYRFGANEDVPTGYAFQAVAGRLNRDFQTIQYYTGLSASGGILFERTGYFAVQLAYGNYFNAYNVNTGLVKANVFYFSNLAQFGRWSVRQFASLQSLFGIDQPDFRFVNLNGTQLYGFSSSKVQGKSKAILNLETVFYMPYTFFGFRLAPVLFVGAGKIGNNPESVLNSPLFTAVSLGLLVRNENLILNTFELSVGFYPYIPDGNGYRFLPISSYRLKVRDFALPRPEVLLYE